MHIRHLIPVLPLAAAALLAAPAAAVLAAPAASASVQETSRPAGTFAACTAIESGRYRYIGPGVYDECVRTGFGWYWLRWTPGSWVRWV
jgi:hypothetical protein